MDAKSQQRPEERWLVMGAPSNGIFMLKICWSLIFVALLVSTAFGSAEERADNASLIHQLGQQIEDID